MPSKPRSNRWLPWFTSCAENEVLKNQIAAAESERLHLRQTMTVARERLEGLMDKLPEDA